MIRTVFQAALRIISELAMACTVTNSPVAHHQAGEIDLAHGGKRVEPDRPVAHNERGRVEANYTNVSFARDLINTSYL